MDKLRMFHWLLIAAVLYLAATIVTQPQLQIVLWKAGHITVAAFAGYWIDRAAFREARLSAKSDPRLQIRRAIVIGAAMLAISMGL
jgi:hypothetical protein